MFCVEKEDAINVSKRAVKCICYIERLLNLRIKFTIVMIVLNFNPLRKLISCKVWRTVMQSV